MTTRGKLNKLDNTLTWSKPILRLSKFIDFRDIRRPDNTVGTAYMNKRDGQYITPEEFDRVFSDVEVDYYIVKTKEKKIPICVFSVEKGKQGISDGIVGLWHTQYLVSMRRRNDGRIGLETVVDGHNYTLVSMEEKLRDPISFAVPGTTAKEADFGKSGKYFKCYKLDL